MASEQDPVELARESDIDKLQDVVRCDRILTSHLSRWPAIHSRSLPRLWGTQTAHIDHQGANDGFVEKASVVHYFHAGKWLQLTGAD